MRGAVWAPGVTTAAWFMKTALPRPFVISRPFGAKVGMRRMLAGSSWPAPASSASVSLVGVAASPVGALVP